LAEGVTAMVLAAIAACAVATYFEIFPLDLLFWVLVAVVASMSADRGSRVDADSTELGIAEIVPSA
jgi:hypothetical protein